VRDRNSEPKVGLARALSKLGYCSRARAFELARAGRVAVNGTVRRHPESPVSLACDRIQVDGREFAPAARIYLALNKPRGLITTASDERGRDTVYSLLDPSLPWVAPVGRLDKASEGLLLLTNDSEWGARITSPETHLEKIYHVQIAALADESILPLLIQGVAAETAERLRVRSARVVRYGEKNTWLEIVLDEGRNRHIRRIFEALHLEVLRLVRIAIGPLVLGDLAKGQSRTLTATEKRALDEAMSRRR
jgi:23S rRNA pseudouridine2605 synthase